MKDCQKYKSDEKYTTVKKKDHGDSPSLWHTPDVMNGEEGVWCSLQILIRLNKYTRACAKNCHAFIMQCTSRSSQLPLQTPQRCWLKSHHTIVQRCCLTSHNTQLHNLLTPTAVLSIECEPGYNSCSLPKKCMGKGQISLVLRSHMGPATWMVWNCGCEEKWPRHLIFHQKFYSARLFQGAFTVL